MNSRPLPPILALLLAVSGLLTFSACGKASNMADGASDVDYYTCTMHPSVRSHDPHAKCPICSMDLVPVLKRDRDQAGTEKPVAVMAGSGQPTEFTIPLDRQQLIGVTYAKVVRRPLRSVIRALGTVAVDRQRRWEYVARVAGYVHELKVFAPGERVEKGQALLDLYSPDLAATEDEFLDLLKMRDAAGAEGSTSARENADRLLASARQRLIQWNVTDDQISALMQSRQAPEFLTLVSPFRGIVEAVPVVQGRRVMPGDPLVEIADLSEVWVWVDFYQEELPLLKVGMAITVTSSSLPGKVFHGKIALIDPFINESRRTGRVRIDLANPDFKLRPSMYVDAVLALDRGDGLVVPVGAVLPTGQHNIVFVDKGGGKLEPRFVELGGKFGDVYAVSSGLQEGERVVSSANFLIDAESKVQGALKSW